MKVVVERPITLVPDSGQSGTETQVQILATFSPITYQ